MTHYLLIALHKLPDQTTKATLHHFKATNDRTARKHVDQYIATHGLTDIFGMGVESFPSELALTRTLARTLRMLWIDPLLVLERLEQIDRRSLPPHIRALLPG